MFAYIRGTLMEATPQYCVLDVNGVGYKLFTPANLLNQLPAIGKEVLLHSSFIVRELSQTLYGFLTPQEKELFELLIGITGIGPKMALSIIGHFSLQELHSAITLGNNMALCKIPGIGKKTAERLIVEMRDKLKAMAPPEPAGFFIPQPNQKQTIVDAMSALIHLGYTQAIAQKAIQRGMQSLPEDADLASLITSALKNI